MNQIYEFLALHNAAQGRCAADSRGNSSVFIKICWDYYYSGSMSGGRGNLCMFVFSSLCG